jgi:hypothetical protein
MKRNPLLILATAAAVLIGACSWEMPEEVVFRGQPSLWIPAGAAVFDMDVNDEIIDEFTQSVVDPNLTAGEKYYGGYDGKPLTLYAELEFVTDFPGTPPGIEPFDAFFDGQTDPLDLSEVSGPIPEEVLLVEVPGWAWFEPDPLALAPYPDVYVRLEAQWTDDGVPKSEDLLGTSGSGGFVLLASDRAAANAFYLTAIFNDRPADLVLYYEFGANSAEIADIESLHILVEVPFEFDSDPWTYPGIPLDFEEDGENPLLLEDDIFGRDPAEPDEDLEELLDSIRGSNAAISLTFTQTTGLGLQLAMINSADPVFVDEAAKKNPDNWVIEVVVDPGEAEQTVEVEITPQILDQMIDGAGPDDLFIPEFLIFLPENFQINNLWEFRVSKGYLRVQAVIDYSFSLEDEE